MKHRYVLLHKPFDVLCQFSGDGRTLRDYVQIPNVYPVGRLDRDSEGLLLLTNDGGLQHQLTDPRFEHPRTYWAQVEGIPDEPALRRLREGIAVQDYRTRPAQARLLDSEPPVGPRNPPIRYRESIPTTWIELILTEGRNRQVRRMTAAVGYPTLRLIRYAIGSVTLDGLAPGDSRDLTAAELKRLRR